MTKIKSLLNWYLNDVHCGDYEEAFMVLFFGALVAFLAVMFIVLTHGWILLPAAIIAGIFGAMYWADENRGR